MGIENCAGGGFDVKGKSSSSSNSRVGRDLVGLGLKLQSTESLPLNMMMSHHHHPFSSSEYLDDDGVVRSTRSTSRSNIYSDDVPLATAGGIAAAAAFVRTLQPFDISPSNFSNTSLESPGGGGMAPTTWGFPFTSVQWKELERQAMIYKCMMAALPVPPDLLLPTNLSADPSATHSPSSIFNSRLAGNKDPEPGRCKRTDGKKWRCSRDVAPNQKYCERHMHRGRPRSRKPVEVHAPRSNDTTVAASNSKKGRLNHSHFLSTPNDFPNQTFSSNCSSPRLLGSTIHPNDQNNSALFKEPNRGLELGIEGGMVTMETSGSQWQHLMKTNMGFNSSNNACVFQQDYVLEPLNLLSYSDFSDREQQAFECNLFLNPDLVSLEKQSQMDTSRGFIDAWSNENTSTPTTTKRKESSGNSHGYGNLSPSSLTLSMAMAVGGEERNKIQMNGGVKDSENPRGQMDASWPNAVPWVIPTPGGPLAEVLRPSAVTVGSSSDPPTSPSCAGNGDSISPQLTVSSPSGVLHRTMLSLSDGSVCNSPTIAASTATPENVAFHWLT